ncbi:MAG: phytoene desaturase [Gemmatimonadaceae bacterium]
MKIVVIGSGFGGLSAAIRLQAQGHAVTLVEKLDKPGGRAYVFEQDGFKFDAGPTIITAPWLIRELFEVAGKKMEDHVTLKLLDPFYNIRFDDGSVFRYNANREELIAQVRSFSDGKDVAGYDRFLKSTEEIFKAGMALLDRPFPTVTSMLNVLPDLVRLRADRSVASYVDRFISEKRLKQVFSFHPLLVGGNPFRASAIYALIHTLEQQWGVWFAMGGTGALVQALANLFTGMGGELRLNCEVGAIDVDRTTKLSTGVQLVSGEAVSADAVVCNGDVAMATQKLIPAWARPRMSDRKIANFRYSMSLFVIYFGTNKQYPDTAHHEILMGPRYRELLEDIFEGKILADDFSLYLHRPTATDPSLAPPGHDCWYVLSPVPHLGAEIDWELVSQRYRDRIMQFLEDNYLPGLQSHIVTERRIDPRYFENTLNSYLGSAFGPEPTLMQSAYLRPHNQSQDVSNLYFCGAGTHPGAGLPGVIASGKIVADLIGQRNG